MSDDLFAGLPTGFGPAPAARPATAASYDAVPYTSMPFSQTHPSRLFALATLFGLTPAPPQKCRVLELGCAGGGNLIPMADYLPDSEFVGVDLSGGQIAEGKALVDQIGLGNVILKQANILDVDAAYGTFDYIIAHGVYSWVPADVRDKLLDICRKLLSPNGVAYVSYNTYPGWHMRGAIRDMMLYHAGRFDSPDEKVQQARALLDFLAASAPADSPYGHFLKSELEGLQTQSDYYLFHEHLEDVNQPVFFHQFIAAAQAKGLKYLGEARVGTMVTGNFGPEVEQTLRRLATDQVMAEQYMDFLRNRMFRETLLCHAEKSPNWAVPPEAVRGLHVASAARPQMSADATEFNVADTSPVAFVSPGGLTVTTPRPLMKAALMVLQQTFPATLPFDVLRREARVMLGGNPDEFRTAGEDGAALAVGLLSCYMGSDLIELHGVPVMFARTPGERPVALPHVRVLAGRTGTVANRRHEVIRLNELDRHMLPLLDGTRTRPELVDELTAVAVTGKLTLRRNDQPITAPADIKAALGEILDEALNRLARMAVLAG